MFDSVLSTSNLNLLQHGMLPENLALPYKLTNLKSIYTFDLLSQNIFISLFDLSQDVLFYLLESKLCLSKTSYKRSVLIIGQPQSVFYEMEILQYLIKIEDIDMIFIKPHPLYSMEAYKNIKSPKVSVIYDKLYFPEVMVALNFESTLGLEYQKIGIPVISIKDKRKSNVLLEVIEAMKL
ncbi:hypothetical protein ACOBWA_09265 [Psychrobacter sp. ER1]|uniref:hypothetical protein n=1 Tax=Psychrobacter sp. ER1 TaxID=3406645 RepID=UPI003B42C581